MYRDPSTVQGVTIRKRPLRILTLTALATLVLAACAAPAGAPANWKAGIPKDPPDLTEKLSLSGSPDEWVERIRNDVLPTGFNHMICAPIDAYLVKAWSGLRIENVPDQQGQLRLIHDRVMPAFAGDPSGPS